VVVVVVVVVLVEGSGVVVVVEVVEVVEVVKSTQGFVAQVSSSLKIPPSASHCILVKSSKHSP
jgi:microcystin degradation protein MlrC